MSTIWSTSKENIYKDTRNDTQKKEDHILYEEFKSKNANDIDELLYAYENELLKEKTDYMKRMLLMDENEKVEKEFKIGNIEKKIQIIRRMQSQNIEYVTDMPMITFRRILSAL